MTTRFRYFRRPNILVTCLVFADILAGVALSRAQTTAPAPVSSPAPTPVVPRLTYTAGIMDLTAYNLARRPTVSVVIAFSGAASTVPIQQAATFVTGTQTATAATTTNFQPHSLSGVFSEINLGYLSGDSPPPPAAITLQFSPSRAGTSIWVQTLDGGTLQTVDASGNPIVVNGGGWIVLNASGQASFTFQAPAQSYRYHVLVRLDNVSTFLRFLIPDPTQG